VRDHQRDVHAARQQHLQAAHADVVVGEDDGARRRGSQGGRHRGHGLLFEHGLHQIARRARTCW
jgi:predicted Zn-dependent protease